MSASTPLVRCDQLVIGYRGSALLPAFSFAIQPGEIVLVVGGNGAGKTTWLRTILGLIPPVSGSVDISEGTHVAYVPQRSAIDDMVPLSVQDVAGWGRLRGWSFINPLQIRRERAAIDRAIVTAGAREFVTDSWRELSGGQKQRALFARMLASDTDLALLDEPTAAMDMTAEREAYEQLTELARTERMAQIIVTHTLAVAAKYADKAIFFDRGSRETGPTVFSGALGDVFARAEFRRKFGQVAYD